jgi:hypothetical protein
MYPEYSIPSSQKPAIGDHPNPDELTSSYHRYLGSLLILLLICTFSALLKMTLLSEKRLAVLQTKSLHS